MNGPHALTEDGWSMHSRGAPRILIKLRFITRLLPMDIFLRFKPTMIKGFINLKLGKGFINIKLDKVPVIRA